MNKKHFIAPIVEDWIRKINDNNSSSFVRENYAGYLEETRKAIENALRIYNLEKKK